MAGKFIKESLPWLVPSAALIFVGTGYIDRIVPANTESTDVAVQETAAAATPETMAAPAAQGGGTSATALAAAVAAATEPTLDSEVAGSTAAQVAALVDAATGEAATPDVTRNAPLSAAPLTEPVAEQVTAPDPMTNEQAAAFFASAQANLATDSKCAEDLKALAANARIYFPSGGLAGEDAGLSQARLIGLVARDCPGYTVQVEGHSDPSGDPAINLRLSQQRAEAVIARLAASGIDTSNFIATGYGDTRPSGLRGPQPDAYYDRRVEFTVVPVAQNASFTTSAAPQAWETVATGCAAQLETIASGTKVFYAPGSISAKPSDMELIVDIAAQAARCGEVKLRVVGHHSDDPSAREDVATGRLRALAIMSTLVASGFEAEQILIGAPSWSVDVPGNPALPNNRVDFEVIVTGG